MLYYIFWYLSHRISPFGTISDFFSFLILFKLDHLNSQFGSVMGFKKHYECYLFNLLRKKVDVIRKNKFNMYYIKYVVKSPIVFVGFIFIGLILFLALTLTNKANIMETYDAQFYIINGKYTIDFTEQTPKTTNGYLYIDQNEIMYPVEFVSLSSNKCEVISENTLPFDDSTEIKVDIIECEASLFYIIFVKGGGI